MSDNKKIILIVEDEDILVKSLQEKLLSEGFRVSVAYDGNDGLKRSLSEHPDLILLDILLPKCDGAKMLKDLRNDKWGRSAKVIILTNIKETNQMNKMMNISADIPNNTFDYIIKTDLSLAGIVDRIKQRLL